MPGEGSTFSVKLPLVNAEGKHEPTEPRCNINDLACMLIGPQSGFTEDWGEYLRADGARITYVADLTSARAMLVANAPDMQVWIIDTASDEPVDIEPLREIVRGTGLPANAVRFVLIGRGMRRHPHLLDHGCVTVDANLLSHRALVKAIALAAGRTSEQEEVAQSGRSERDFRPVSRFEALKLGRLILVAEDNETNRKVILRQLALLGYAADVADNGLQALQCWLKGEYALLLTDLHMPGMDGYQLTETIRTEEAGHRHIPIIALTANAFRSEADRCRAAGMDDYLSKPVQLADLKSTLEKWLLPIVSVPQPAKVEVRLPEGAPMDLAVLKDLVGTDPEVIREILIEFRASADQIAQAISTTFRSGETMRGGSEAHKLKSSARAIGALALGELCAELESSGSSRNAAELGGLLDAFTAEMDRVNRFLDELPELKPAS
jgi:CheY-like chemotaxis protein